ncbi:hypothetical protein D3C75_949710 [compost metagenome]
MHERLHASQRIDFINPITQYQELNSVIIGLDEGSLNPFQIALNTRAKALYITDKPLLHLAQRSEFGGKREDGDTSPSFDVFNVSAASGMVVQVAFGDSAQIIQRMFF